MDNLDIEFLTRKHEELIANGNILILKAKHTARIPDLREAGRNFKDTKFFYIGEDENRRIVMQYKTFIPNFNYRECKKEGDRAFYTHKYEKAIEYYSAFLNIGQVKPHLYARIGLSYLYLGNLYKAIDYLTIATELSKKRKKGKYDFTDLINNLLKRKEENPEEMKNNINMSESDFQYDLDNYYGVEKIKDVAMLINLHNMTIDEACSALNVSAEDKILIMLFIAKESYAKGDMDLGDRILKQVEKSSNKTLRIKELLVEIRTNRLFYKNRVTNDYQPLIRVRVKTH
ncbi:MAG: hypothetical protein NC483_02800 [Ruminococcus sp.]|nr:hypothetical protein [Ruminococcus sp.]